MRWKGLGSDQGSGFDISWGGLSWTSMDKLGILDVQDRILRRIGLVPAGYRDNLQVAGPLARAVLLDVDRLEVG